MDDVVLELLDARGQVRPEKVSDLIIEVSSGRCLFASSTPPNDLYACCHPTAKQQDDARIIYARALHDARRRGLMSKEQIEAVAIEHQEFDPQARVERRNLIGMIEKYTKAREISTDPSHKLKLDQDIQSCRGKVLMIDYTEYEVFQYSAEALAESARSSYYVYCCTFGGELLDQPVWPSYEAYKDAHDLAFVADAQRAFHRVQSGLPIKVLRALARTNEWRSRWKGSKETGSAPFDGPSHAWDGNKLALIYWSDFYDAVHQHPECPGQDVIENDEYLGNWLNTQMAKRKQSSPGGGGKPIYQRDGAGNRKPMTKVGESTSRINTPFRMPTRG